MRLEIVALDMRHVDGFCYARQLVNIPGKTPDIRVIDNSPEIGLEMRDINRIETYKRRKQSHVRFCQFITCQVAGTGEYLFDPIK